MLGGGPAILWDRSVVDRGLIRWKDHPTHEITIAPHFEATLVVLAESFASSEYLPSTPVASRSLRLTTREGRGCFCRWKRLEPARITAGGRRRHAGTKEKG